MKTYHVCRILLAALFLFAAGTKIALRNHFKENFFTNVEILVEDTMNLPASWGYPIAVPIIATEVAVGLMLLTRRTAKAGAVGVALLLVTFAAYALYYRFGLGHEQGLECGCFGGLIKSQLGVSTAIRNLLLLLPVYGVLRQHGTVRRRASVSIEPMPSTLRQAKA